MGPQRPVSFFFEDFKLISRLKNSFVSKGIWSAAFLFFSTSPALGLAVDQYVGPFGSFSYPLYSQENSFTSPVISSSFRNGFRIESGSVSDGVSVDFRFSNRSKYLDYGLMFRGFGCLGAESSLAFCAGAGVGGSYSPGFITDPPDRSFFDLLVNPFARVLVDFTSKSTLVFDLGVLAVPARSFSTPDPIENDSRTKLRVDASVGLLVDFVEIGSGFGFGQSPAAEGVIEPRFAEFGLKGGFPLSRYSGTSSTGAKLENSSRTGLMGGVTLDLGGEGFGFLTDVFYTVRRYGITESSSALFERIEIPGQFRYRTEGPSFFMTTLGGYYALPLGTATVVSGNNTVAVTNVSYKPDMGWMFGGGWGVQSEATTFTFEIRYSLGLVNLISTPSGAESAKSRLVDVLFGFLF